jgi:hypothetical protein
MKGLSIPDAQGWQWGVRFQDNSVHHSFSGRTQHEKAVAFLNDLKCRYGDNEYALVRRRPGGEWRVF